MQANITVLSLTGRLVFRNFFDFVLIRTFGQTPPVSNTQVTATCTSYCRFWWRCEHDHVVIITKIKVNRESVKLQNEYCYLVDGNDSGVGTKVVSVFVSWICIFNGLICLSILHNQSVCLNLEIQNWSGAVMDWKFCWTRKLCGGFTLHSEVSRTSSGQDSLRIVNVEIPVKSNAFHQSKIT